MIDPTYDQILRGALKLNAADQARLIERLAAEVHATLDHPTPEDELRHTDDEPALTPDEIGRLLKQGPKTGAEIAASDAVGGWAHLDIADGAAWVNEQKRKRSARKSW